MSLSLTQINAADNGSAGNTGSSPGANGTGGGAADETFNSGSFDVSSGSNELDFTPSANGGLGGGGASGTVGVPGTASATNPAVWSAGTNGGTGGNGGAGGEASVTLGTINVGSASTATTTGVELTGTVYGGRGVLATGGLGGGGGSSGLNDLEDIGGQPGNGGSGGGGGFGGSATVVFTDFISYNSDTFSRGTDIFTRVTGTNGGGGGGAGSGNQGGLPSNGGTGGAGGGGGAATDSLTSSTFVDNTEIFLQSLVSGGAGGNGGNGGGAGDERTDNGSGLETLLYGANGAGGNGGAGGNASALMSGDTLTAPTIVMQMTVSAGANSTGGTSPSVAAVNTASESTAGAASGASGTNGAEGSGSIVFTNNVVTVGEGFNESIPLNNQGALDLAWSIVNTGSINNNVTQSLNGGAGGNLTFSGNTFIGQGHSTLDLQLGGTGSVVLDLSNDVMSIAGSPTNNAISGFSTFDLDNNNTVIAGSGSVTLNFASDPDTLIFTPTSGNVTINNASTTDMVLEFKGFSGLNASTLASDTTESGGNTFITINGATIELTGFTSAIPAGEESIQCFREGKRLAAPGGWIKVEELAVGDVLLTHDGDTLPVRWIGSRRVDCLAFRRPESVMPVRVAAGAFGPGMPERDVFLSPDHAVFTHGVLIPVKYLINGESIARWTASEVVWFHVETTEHAVLLAEGLPAESYLDTGAGWFGEDDVISHPRQNRAEGAAAMWETRAAAPLCVSGPVLERARMDLYRPAPAAVRHSSSRSGAVA